MNFLSSVSSGIYLVYGLVALLIILIIVIIVVDKKETKRETQNLFDTLNMKIISDNSFDDEPEIIEIKQEEKVNESFNDIATQKTTDLNEARDKIKETIKLMDMEDMLVEKESDLEKTQAQLRVESITKALEEANIDEKIEEDKYQKFEEEQEKNAIISYKELKDSFDKLYSENEKIQYIDDDTIPININELYELSDEISKENNEEVNVKEELIEVKTDNLADTQFRNSPYISPVYGIQKPPVVSNVHKNDEEIEDATRFLHNLKELQSNLE